MIKSVSIQNFEAHEDTTVEFGDGMNSLVGWSNSGKSSILRALMVVVNNEWNKDMVRTGYEFCRVRVETERGWVEAERGEKVNRWRCKEGDNEIQLFQKVGISVPELATRILGMGKRDRGNGISELPNFQTQLEKHYMLAEVGEKKATSNMIAVMMDNAIGLGGMEDLIKDFSADLAKDRKWLTEKQAEIVELKTSIMDEMIFRQRENEIGHIGELQESIATMDSDISVADGHLARHNDVLQRNDDALARLDSMPDCGELDGIVDDAGLLGRGIASVERAFSIEKSLCNATAMAGIDVDKMHSLAEACSSLEKSIDACGRILDCEGRLADANDVVSVDVPVMEMLESEADAMEGRIDEATGRLENARDLWKRQFNASKEAKSLGNELKDAEAEFESLKKELGVCPLCGGRL